MTVFLRLLGGDACQNDVLRFRHHDSFLIKELSTMDLAKCILVRACTAVG